MPRRRRHGRRQRGLTVFEIVIVIAIIGMLSWLATGALRWLRGANGIDTAVELAAVMRRTGQLAAGSGALHRLVIDLDTQAYRVEVCAGGPAAIAKDPVAALVEQTDEARQRALADARERLSTLPQGSLPTGGDAERGDEMALALAGQLAARRTCQITGELFGDPDGRDAVRQVHTERGARVRRVWVQHLSAPVQSGPVAIHFFPVGSAEKAIIEVVDTSDKPFTVVVHGLTGRVEVRHGALRDPDAFLYRDALGEEVRR
jgi:hypothetical protein